MNLNFNKTIGLIKPLLILFTIALLVSRVIFSILPKESIEYKEIDNQNIKFTKYDFINSFDTNQAKRDIVQNKKIIKKEYLLEQNIMLKAIYLFANKEGLAVIKEKSKNDSQILSKNEYFKEYKLVNIKTNYVVFEKNNKLYKLYMTKLNKEQINIEIQNKIKPKISNKGVNSYTLKKKDLKSYSKNLKKVWNNIALKTYKKKGKSIGFIIYKIKKNSVFEDLGLKKSDILIKANNLELTNYQNAFKIYKEIDKMDLMQLTILRNNKEMELSYEIE